MNVKSFSLVMAASFLGACLAHANVTTVTDSGWNGGIYCYLPLSLVDSSGDLGMSASQTGTGSAWATIYTSDTVDPTLSINNTVDNDTTFAWTEYIVNVSLNTNFTILSAGVAAPPGWTNVITQPGTPVGGVYTGTIDYLAGTPVAIDTNPTNPPPDSSLNFNYQIQFSGLTQYSLTETVVPVPEPGTFSLLGFGGALLGGCALAGRRREKRCTKV